VVWELLAMEGHSDPVNVRDWFVRVMTRVRTRKTPSDPLRQRYDPTYSRVSRIDMQRQPGRTTNWPVTVERFDTDLNEVHE